MIVHVRVIISCHATYGAVYILSPVFLVLTVYMLTVKHHLLSLLFPLPHLLDSTHRKNPTYSGTVYLGIFRSYISAMKKLYMCICILYIHVYIPYVRMYMYIMYAQVEMKGSLLLYWEVLYCMHIHTYVYLQ